MQVGVDHEQHETAAPRAQQLAALGTQLLARFVEIINGRCRDRSKRFLGGTFLVFG